MRLVRLSSSLVIAMALIPPVLAQASSSAPQEAAARRAVAVFVASDERKQFKSKDFNGQSPAFQVLLATECACSIRKVRIHVQKALTTKADANWSKIVGKK